MTQSQVFAAPPYNKSAAAVGHTNWALLLGSIIGMATAGPLSDWISMKMTKTNNGIREPEMRLVSLIPFTIASSIGTLVVAYGYQYKWRFELIVWLGYTLLGVQVSRDVPFELVQ